MLCLVQQATDRIEDQALRVANTQGVNAVIDLRIAHERIVRRHCAVGGEADDLSGQRIPQLGLFLAGAITGPDVEIAGIIEFQCTAEIGRRTAVGRGDKNPLHVREPVPRQDGAADSRRPFFSVFRGENRVTEVDNPVVGKPGMQGHIHQPDLANPRWYVGKSLHIPEFTPGEIVAFHGAAELRDQQFVRRYEFEGPGEVQPLDHLVENRVAHIDPGDRGKIPVIGFGLSGGAFLAVAFFQLARWRRL